MLKFEHIEYLNALWLLIPLFAFFVWYSFYRKKKQEAFASNALFKRLAPFNSSNKLYIKFTLYVLAYISLCVGLANPQIGTKFETVKREGVDVMIAIDVSKSMDAKDTQPSRMLKARQFVSNLITKMSNDRVGLIVFAGNAYLQMPLTIDYSAARMYLKQVNTNLIPNQGTAIGAAVNIAQKSFPENGENQKVMIVISDGENHEGDAESAIEQAKKNGIKVITIGVGTTKGAPIPLGAKGQFKKDNKGEIVTTKLNEGMLKDLAKEANGTYYNIADNDAMDNIVASLGSLDGKVFEEKVITDYKDHFQLFLLIAIVLLIIEFVMSYKKSKIQLNLFKEK